MKLGRQWDERLRIWDEAFGRNLYTRLGEAELSGFTTMEQLSLEQAMSREFQPFPRGREWGRKWEYGWFRASVTMQKEAAGKRILLHLGAGPEMLVYVNGREAGSIDSKHSMVELTASAKPGERFEIYAECYAGHGVRQEGAGICRRGDVPVPEPSCCQCVVGSSHFGIHNEEMFAAYADYHTLYELWKVLPDSELRTVKIGEALQCFTCIVDFEAEEPRRSESVREGREVLLPLLGKRNGDTMPEFTVFGQSHLDLAWLWPLEETKRKAARTYSNQLALMERYPDYKFLLCCPTVLEYLKEYYPELFRRVREQVKAGRFLPEGAVYVESDTNLPGGESLIRQFVLGKRWYMDTFGVDSHIAWMPDTFGFSGALPQIMKGCRVPYFATQKLLRCDPECQQFPYNVFWWEGIDGTRILSHIYKKNNAVFSSGALRERWEKDRNQKQEIDTFLFPFGYGDGGGGPTELMVETAMRCRDLEGAPRCTMESPTAFFDRLDGSLVRNVYYGELYLAWHRGTYTAQAGIKRGVRRAEYALREAEYLAGLLRLGGGWEEGGAEEASRADSVHSAEPAGCLEDAFLRKLEELWKLLLVQEFHDILPGTSIERVNREAVEALEQVERESRELAEELLYRLAGSKALFNSLSWERSFGGLRLPACGYVRLGEDAGIPEADGQVREMREGTGDSGAKPFAEKCFTSMEEIVFQNKFYCARMDRQGRLTSLISRAGGYEYAQEPLNQWRLYRDVNVDYDAWELGGMYEQTPEALSDSCTLRTREYSDGSVTAVVERREEYFTARQSIRFRPDSPRIDFETEIDWQERHRILKVDFPTTVYTKEILQEIQFGYMRRPTHKSGQYEQDLYETCHHKYAVLTDGENGFALINDCKYGLSARDSRISLTLLRAPVMPDMTADRGIHRFTYSVMPFSGPFVHSRVTEEAYECNVKVTAAGFGGAIPAGERGTIFERASTRLLGLTSVKDAVSFFHLEGGHVILETCKPAFDRKNGVVLRLYETKGCAGETLLTVPDRVKRAFACNMLEETEEELALEAGKLRLRFHSFEIRTLLLESDRY
ncbi:MAG: alpha-mannosidase [Lachnospiraceae bacterium]|nr:glycoside hydrolase family 38 C-terminal domain-containing protein [uncultured Acetatifactor sp.]MCI8286883.1 alpha-mannosidase [Lachnospiraceae bacterium]